MFVDDWKQIDKQTEGKQVVTVGYAGRELTVKTNIK
jgi:hypothetical protein